MNTMFRNHTSERAAEFGDVGFQIAVVAWGEVFGPGGGDGVEDGVAGVLSDAEEEFLDDAAQADV